MGNSEPEGLYPAYREELTKKLVSIMKHGDSFRVAAPSGRGKSKYFRYITASTQVKDQYFAPENIDPYYYDLNRIYEQSAHHIIRQLSQMFDTDPTGNAIEVAIKAKLDRGNKVYIIWDQCELLNTYDIESIRFIRSLRDSFKRDLGFIFAYEPSRPFIREVQKYLFEIAPLELGFPKLPEVDARQSLESLMVRYEIDITEEDKNAIISFADGSGRLLNQTIMLLATGSTVNEAIQTVSTNTRIQAAAYEPPVVSEKPDEKPIEQTDIGETGLSDSSDSNGQAVDPLNLEVTLSQCKKSFTKSEYACFEILFTHMDNVVSRDEIAESLYPDSNGDGVSNEAIDQLMSRVRKAIKKEGLSYRVVNKHGVGYYLEPVKIES